MHVHLKKTRYGAKAYGILFFFPSLLTTSFGTKFFSKGMKNVGNIKVENQTSKNQESTNS
jgi:hypothetical protein